jgi:pantoate--beta-alanine ligase
MAIEIIKDPASMQAWARAAALKKGPVVLVPTMGALHNGHKGLLAAAKGLGGSLVLSIFVNRLQFGPTEDFGAYPRDMDRDLKTAEECGVSVVFAPEEGLMYPTAHSTYVDVEGLSKRLCGKSRPGHFRGVATVVLKLFNIAMPRTAVFGKKDYQQLLIIRKMVKDLNLPIDVNSVETVRESDGLAMSSRNAYLSKEERQAASSIPKALLAAREAFERGVRSADEIIAHAKKIMENQGLVMVEYLDVCDTETLEDIRHIEDRALVAVAARVGRARLIDNVVLSV